MSLTKVTNSMIQGAQVNVLDYGADPTGVADSYAAMQAAFTAAGNGVVYLPPGTYKISASIITYGSWYGCGRQTEIRPTGDFPALNVQSAHLNGDEFGFAYGYTVNYASAGVLTANGSAHWLNKGGTNTGTSSTGSFQFSDIYCYGSYHAFYQSSSDIAILWNVSFNNIAILANIDYGIYIDGSGDTGSLQVSFDNILIDGLAVATAKGTFLRALTKLRFHGISTGIGANTTGGVLYVIDCANAQVDFQCESITVTTPNSYLVAFLNCHQVKFRGQFTSIVTNVEVGNTFGYTYFDANNENIIVESVYIQAPTTTTGTAYKVVVSDGATISTNLKVLDKTILPIECSIPSAILNRTTFQEGTVRTENGALYNSSNQSSVSTATIIYPWVNNNNIAVEPQSAFIMVNGVALIDANINFVDLLIVISSTSNSYGKVLTVVSSNGYGTPSARTYTQDATGNLLCAMASGTYYVRTSALHGYAPYR